jgi:P27 family predicted phage terminase small subunit
MTTKHPPPPAHLSASTKKWWKSVVAEFLLEEHHRHLLKLACEALDRAEGARETLATLGTTYTDRFGAPRARPEVAIERDARISFARLVRELDLDTEVPSSGHRPPPLRSNRRF